MMRRLLDGGVIIICIVTAPLVFTVIAVIVIVAVMLKPIPGDIP
jgi:hypothetical protein